MEISLNEVVGVTKRPWRDWANGVWHTVPGLGDMPPECQAFRSSLSAWALRSGRYGQETMIMADGALRFRIAPKRPDAKSGMNLLYSTERRAWWGNGPDGFTGDIIEAGYHTDSMAEMVVADRLKTWDTTASPVPPVVAVPVAELPEVMTEDSVMDVIRSQAASIAQRHTIRTFQGASSPWDALAYTAALDWFDNPDKLSIGDRVSYTVDKRPEGTVTVTGVVESVWRKMIVDKPVATIAVECDPWNGKPSVDWIPVARLTRVEPAADSTPAVK